jgi:GNAT superfamily N-acetyltransferase
MALEKKQWTIRTFQKEDGPEVLELLGTSFRKEFTPEWFQWKYENLPFGEAVLHVAESLSGEIIGFHAYFQWPLLFQNKVIRGLQGTDLVVRSDYQNQGIMSSLVEQGDEEARERGAWLRFGFANANSLQRILKLSHKIVDHLEIWCRVFRPIQFLRNELMAVQKGKKSEPLPMDMDNKYFLPARDHIDHLVKLQGKGSFSGLRSLRSEGFYKWRLNHPHRPCYVVSLDGKTPLMMVHFQKAEVGGRALLMEQYVPANSSEWKGAMKMIGQSGEIDSIYTIANRSPEDRSLDFVRWGSRLLTSRTTLVVKVLRKEAEQFLSKALWDLAPLDLEFY